MKHILIGRSGNQPFAINDSQVSSRHALLEVRDNGTMTLTDQQSTNGTYVYINGQYMRLAAGQPYTVTPDTFIQLGPNTRFHVRRLLAAAQPKPGTPPPIQAPEAEKKKPPTPPQPERINIAGLRVVSDNYNNAKMEIEAKMGTVNTLRSLTLLASLVGGGGGKMLAPVLFPNVENIESISWGVGIVLIIILLVTLMMIINSRNRKLLKMRSQNDKYYARHYQCPKCHADFRNRLYDNILAEGKCPRCKVEYYEA